MGHGHSFSLSLSLALVFCSHIISLSLSLSLLVFFGFFALLFFLLFRHFFLLSFLLFLPFLILVFIMLFYASFSFARFHAALLFNGLNKTFAQQPPTSRESQIPARISCPLSIPEHLRTSQRIPEPPH